MSLRRPRSAAIACAVIALAAVAATGCGKRELETPREGQGVKVAGVTYNVYITRQLNPHDAEDSAYTAGQNADQAGYYFYGVFLTACNPNEDVNAPHWLAASRFEIEDTQGNTFTPVPQPADSVWAYKARALKQNACIPKQGSLASSGPTNGSLLVFKLPLQALENRPLDLIITSPPDPNGERDEGRIELDV